MPSSLDPLRPGVGPVRQRLMVPTLALLTTTGSVVSSLGAPLVPMIARDTGVSLSTAQWALTATLLAGALTTPIAGRIGGNRRRHVVIVLGMLAVTVGTLLSALPWGFGFMVTGRALQGVGLGLTPLAFAVAREFVPARRTQSTIAFLSVTTVAGAGLGYPAMAYVASLWGVSGAYWLATGIAAATLVLAVVAVPASRATADDRVDWWGAMLLAAGTSAFLVAISQGDPWGWWSPSVLALWTTVAVTVPLWVWRTLRVDHPLVDLRLAALPGTIGPNVTVVAVAIAVYLLLSLMMIVVQAPGDHGFGLGEPVTTAGLLLVPYSLTSVTGSRLTVWLSRRMLPDLVLPVGCAVYLLATLLAAVWHDSVGQLVVVMTVAGAGSGLTFAAMPGLIVRCVPATETGSATAFNHVLKLLGFSTGSALALALLEVFEVDGVVTGRSFVAVVLVSSGIMAVAVAASLVLGMRHRGTVRGTVRGT